MKQKKSFALNDGATDETIPAACFEKTNACCEFENYKPNRN